MYTISKTEARSIGNYALLLVSTCSIVCRYDIKQLYIYCTLGVDVALRSML